MEMTLGTWRRRWFVLKNSCLAYYINDEDDLPRDILLFDKSFTVVRERVDSHHFEIRTTSRTLQLRANTVEECDVWCAKIMSMMRTSEFCKAHVHSSFAPMRDVTSVSALVDANDYFKAGERGSKTRSEEQNDELGTRYWYLQRYSYLSIYISSRSLHTSQS